MRAIIVRAFALWVPFPSSDPVLSPLRGKEKKNPLRISADTHRRISYVARRRKKDRADFSRVNSGLSPFGITVIPSLFFGRMNRNRRLTSLSNCTPIWDSHYTHYNGWRGDIYHYAHTHEDQGKAGQCFHRVACTCENSTQEPRDKIIDDNVMRKRLKTW